MMGIAHLEAWWYASAAWIAPAQVADGQNALATLATVVGGGVLGAGACWFFAKRRSMTQHRVQQELWDRKFRLAEADREAAVSALNQNNVDVKRIKGTFESHVQRIAVLEGELKLERSQNGDLRQQLDQQAGAIETLRGERGEIETAAASSKAVAVYSSSGPAR